MENDVLVQNYGSVVILQILTPEAEAWCDEHLPDDVVRWGRNGVVVEPRYVDDIVFGMESDGLTVGH